MSIHPKTAAVTVVPSLPGIDEVYFALSGKTLEGDGEERRGFCLSVAHNDTSPSCDYNVAKSVFHCKSCELSGGVTDLVTVSGRAQDSRGARKFLKEQKLMVSQTEATVWETASAIYPYCGADGTLLYEVGRWNLGNGGKKFRQRTPNGKGGYNEAKDSLKGVERVPYRLPELLVHVKTEPTVPVYVVEGEKDVENLAKLGATATTNSQGTGWAWPSAWAEKYFAGFVRAFVVADNDDAGRKAARQRAGILARIVPKVRYVSKLPGVGDKGDVTDWMVLSPENDLAALTAICEAGELITATVPEYLEAAAAAIIDNFDDIGAAKWFVAHFEDVARHIADLKSWVVYDAVLGHWLLRGDQAALGLTFKASDSLRAAAADMPERDDFAKFAELVRRHDSRKVMLLGAAPFLQSSITEYDTKPYLLNCKNGTLNTMTRQLQSFAASDRITRRTPVQYDDAADCPRFKKWLMESAGDDAAMYRFLLQVMGSCLEGRIRRRKFFCVFGDRGCGKSTFAAVLRALLGEYSSPVDFSVFADQKNSDPGAASPQLVPMKGARLVVVDEAKTTKLDPHLLKLAIGGDPINLRKLYGSVEHFFFDGVLLFIGNEMVTVPDDEDAIWGKVMPIPFLHKIAVEDDEFVERVLLPELPGVLNLALEGLADLRACDFKMVEPKQVTDARKSEREDQNPFTLFLRDGVARSNPKEKDPKPVGATALSEQYEKWRRLNPTQRPRLGAKKLKAAMEAAGYRSESYSGKTVWPGITLAYVGEGLPAI